MGLFTQTQIDQINRVAKKSQLVSAPAPSKKATSINDEIIAASNSVKEYFKDSEAILITTKQELHEYIDKVIESGYCGIDTETTGLDRNRDYIIGASLYYPGGVECYIPMKHRIPIFEDFYKNQLSYEDVCDEFSRFANKECKLIFANANFDLYMIWKDLKVDLCKSFYYDVILAWRCLKENELHNGLKELYNKYPLQGKGDPKKFSDFFSPKLFPYCKPEIAKLYAANDAKITYELFQWQLPYTVKTHPKCQKNQLEHISDLIWQVEFPLVEICQAMERTGMYIDQDRALSLKTKYHEIYDKEMAALQSMVQEVIDSNSSITFGAKKKAPFTSGKDFNPRSTLHVKYLLYDLMNLPRPQGKESTGVGVISEFNLPLTNKIVEVRSLATNISTFVDKLPDAVSSDGKIHADFKQLGAATGRLSCIAEGELILTMNGLKPIEKLEVGDAVWTYENYSDIELKLVDNVYFTGIKYCVKIEWESENTNDYLICTPDHYLKTNKGWIRACDLLNYSDNFYVLGVDGELGELDKSPRKINTITYLCEPQRVYDIEVATNHNFIASGLCVHNSSNPNLMNIPSKLDDIRQMFRATPAAYDSINFDIDPSRQNTIELELNRWVQIETLDGYKAADHLDIDNDIIVLQFETSEEKAMIDKLDINNEKVKLSLRFVYEKIPVPILS